MPDAIPPALLLERRALRDIPHLPAFWPGRRVVTEGGGEAACFTPGPFRPARLAGREVPVALIVGDGPDPLGDALAATPQPIDRALLHKAMTGLVIGRIGAPPGLPDPGPEELGLPRDAVMVIDPCDPRRAAEASARLMAARAEARHVLAVQDPFAPGAPVLLGSLGRFDPWTILDAAAELRGAGRDLALLAHAAGVRVADGPLAGRDPEEVWAAVLAATRCASPFTGKPCGILEALDILALWKAREAEGRRVAACLRIHPYKRDRVRELVASAAPPPSFHHRPGAAIAAARRRGGAVMAWSASAPEGLREACAAAGVGLFWLEDGFIRSAGLGAAFRAGASFALDGRGPYYDPGQESDLEHLLATAELGPELLARAAALRQAVVARGVTKYNLGGAAPVIPPGRRRVLVPGQVEDDASVQRGGGAVRTNLDLLRAARAAEPEAWLVYKPHPDIEAGFRRGRISRAELTRLADQVLEGAPMAAVLDQVEAVHTITSLTGFEALLRGVPVTCWGTPFYAGWGLTEDRAEVPRRARRLTLDGLVAGALILYPRCLDPLTGLPCPPEVLLERMGRPELFPPGRRARIRAVQGFVTRLVARLRGLR